MKEFFHGWRRKVGLVTLVMACLFLCGWFRSFVICDSLGWSMSAPASPIWGVSASGELFLVAEIPVGWGTFKPSRSLWETMPAEPLDRMIASDTKWSFRCFGFGYARNQFQFIMFPYWSIILSLTFLSAYLILWKPRKRFETSPISANSTDRG